MRLRGARAGVTVRGGLTAVALGIALVIGSLALRSGVLFLVGATIAGIGFGPAFGAAFRLLAELAPAAERAALVSAIFVVSCVAFSVPAIAAGAAVTQFGLRGTAEVYGLALIALAGLALALLRRFERTPVAPAPAPVPAAAAADCGEAR